MIKIKLAKILEDKEMTQTRLTELTGIRPGTVNAYYHGFVKRINKDDLNKLCKALHCKLSDLIEYIPDKEQ